MKIKKIMKPIIALKMEIIETVAEQENKT